MMMAMNPFLHWRTSALYCLVAVCFLNWVDFVHPTSTNSSSPDYYYRPPSALYEQHPELFDELALYMKQHSREAILSDPQGKDFSLKLVAMAISNSLSLSLSFSICLPLSRLYLSFLSVVTHSLLPFSIMHSTQSSLCNCYL